jgi:hypothetical protein
MLATAQIFIPMCFKTIRIAQLAAIEGVRPSSAATDARNLKFFSSPAIVD